MTDTYQIILKYACYGVLVKGAIIADAPPMARWAIGKDLSEFVKWVESRGGTVTKVENTEDQNF